MKLLHTTSIAWQHGEALLAPGEWYYSHVPTQNRREQYAHIFRNHGAYSVSTPYLLTSQLCLNITFFLEFRTCPDDESPRFL
jgi:hypothetical protein